MLSEPLCERLHSAFVSVAFSSPEESHDVDKASVQCSPALACHVTAREAINQADRPAPRLCRCNPNKLLSWHSSLARLWIFTALMRFYVVCSCPGGTVKGFNMMGWVSQSLPPHLAPLYGRGRRWPGLRYVPAVWSDCVFPPAPNPSRGQVPHTPTTTIPPWHGYVSFAWFVRIIPPCHDGWRHITWRSLFGQWQGFNWTWLGFGHDPSKSLVSIICA